MEYVESKKRVRRSRAEIEALLAAFQQSGLTQVAFARQQNLNIATFRRWLSKSRSGGKRREQDQLKGFCSVTLREEGGPFLIRLPGGIEVEGQVDPSWIVQLVKGLQS